MPDVAVRMHACTHGIPLAGNSMAARAACPLDRVMTGFWAHNLRAVRCAPVVTLAHMIDDDSGLHVVYEELCRRILLELKNIRAWHAMGSTVNDKESVCETRC